PFAGPADIGNPPTLFVDAPASGATISGSIPVLGWAIDNAMVCGTAISKVEVFLEGTKLGNAAYGQNRPDVCAAFGPRPGCPNVGFTYSWDTKSASNGPHTLHVSATDSDPSPPDALIDHLVAVNNTISTLPTLFVDAPA